MGDRVAEGDLGGRTGATEGAPQHTPRHTSPAPLAARDARFAPPLHNNNAESVTEAATGFVSLQARSDRYGVQITTGFDSGPVVEEAVGEG